MNIKEKLISNQMILFIMPNTEYNNLIVENLKVLTGEGKSVCYVSLNKTYDALEELFQKNKIDVGNVVFIDAITKTIKEEPENKDNVYFVNSPGALTELSLVINKFLEHGFDYLIFDSLTNLLTYQKKGPVGKFLSSLMNNIKEGGTKAVFYALKEDKELIKHCSSSVDEVVEFEKPSKNKVR